MAYNKYGAYIPDSAVSAWGKNGVSNGSGGVVSAKANSVQSGSSSPGSSGRSASSVASSVLKGLAKAAIASTSPANAASVLAGAVSSAVGNANKARSVGGTSNTSRSYGGAVSGTSAGLTAPRSSSSAGGSSGGYNYNGNTTLQTNDRVSGVTRSENGTPYAQTGASLAGIGMHDWVNDRTDYTTLALNAKSIAELQTRLAERAMKAEAQGLDISGKTPGYMSNEQIARQWRQQTGQYLPESFRGDNGQSYKGYYGQDETGRWGYYADPERTVKLEHGNWNTPARTRSAATTTSGRGSASGGYNSGSSGGSGYGTGGGYGSSGYGGSYSGSYGGSGGYGYGSSGYGGNDLAAQLLQLYNGQSSTYAQALAEQRAAQEAAVKRAVNELEGQKTGINQQYSDLYRQAYINRMNAQKDLEERLAAQGLTGGASESTILGLSTAYADALRQAREQQISELGGLDRAIADTRYSGDVSIAQAAANSLRSQTDRYASVLQNLLSYYDNLAARQQAYDREDERLAWNRQYQLGRDAIEDARYQAQLDADSANASRAWARQVAQALLNQGTMPDDDTLAAAGLTRAQAVALLPQETGYAPTFSQAQVLAEADYARKHGERLTGTLLRDYNYYVYGDPNYGGSAGTAAYAPSSGGTSSGRRSSGGSSVVRSADQLGAAEDAGYNEVLADVQALRRNGETSAAINNVISTALMQGLITSRQASELRGAYVGSGR